MRPELGKKIKIGIWAVALVLAGVLLSSFIFSGDYLKIPKLKKTHTDEALALASVNEAPEAPTLKYFSKDITKAPKVSATAYVVGDLETGDIILGKNQNNVYPIASVSKLMTATVASDLWDGDELVQISKQALATQGENGNFRLNEKIKTNDLFYPLLIESSNDAAEALALHNGRDLFISKMNDKAKELGLANTSFGDPSGLSQKNISTPSELFLLAKYIQEKKSDLFKITTNKSFKNEKHVWFSTNQFLRDDGYLGGKSGYTDPAKQTVVSLFSVPLAKESSRPVAIALLQSTDRKKDVESILQYLKKNIFYGLAADAKDSWAVNSSGVIEPKEPDFVNLSFLGDIMLDRGVKSSVLKNFAGDYSSLFEKMDILKKSDIVFANLEGPASDKGADMRNLYSFRMDPSVIPALKGAGIDVLSMANNHAGDWGITAYVDTLKRLKENEIAYTGGGFNLAEATQPAIVEKYGIKIGYLGFSDVGPNWMKATEESAGILLASNPNFDQIVSDAAKQVDYLVVSFHWGDEYKKIHNARQETLAHKAVDAGAKLVIGHHPHVVEDTEVYKDSFIAYSLGNFIFDQGFSTDTMQGMMLEVKLSKDGSMATKKHTIKLNRVFQPNEIILGKEEKVNPVRDRESSQ